MSEAHTLPLSEVFVSHQGEGPQAGALASFVRLMGCPVQCAWCDTPYTWKKGEKDTPQKMTARDIYNKISELAGGGLPDHMVITGGEPGLFFEDSQDRLVQFIEDFLQAYHLPALSLRRRTVEIETSGLKLPGERMLALSPQLRYTVSPKLGSAQRVKVKGQAEPEDWFKLVHTQSGGGWGGIPFAQSVRFKWVIEDRSDLDEVEAYMRKHFEICHESRTGLGINHMHWLMPQGRTSEEIASRSQMVQAAAVQLGINYSHRVHVEVFGDKRGV